MLVSLYNSKENIKKSENYWGIKLMNHTMKLWERVIEARIKREVTIARQQFGIHARKEYHQRNLLFEHAVGKMD